MVPQYLTLTNVPWWCPCGTRTAELYTHTSVSIYRSSEGVCCVWVTAALSCGRPPAYFKVSGGLIGTWCVHGASLLTYDRPWLIVRDQTLPLIKCVTSVGSSLVAFPATLVVLGASSSFLSKPYFTAVFVTWGVCASLHNTRTQRLEMNEFQHFLSYVWVSRHIQRTDFLPHKGPG